MKALKSLIYITFITAASMSSASPLTYGSDSAHDYQATATDINTFDAKAFCQAVCKTHPEQGGILCHCDEPPMN